MDPAGLLLLRWLFRARRRLLILLGLRRITPRDGERRPGRLVAILPLPRDTGGAYRPKHRMQDPAKDPREPFGSESSSKGQDHGWSGCTMTAGSDVLAYQTFGALELWGGDLRHEQGDLDGGTDLYDLRTAWEAYGESLKIWSGQGWQAVKDAHADRRAIVIQGTGQVPGAGDFDGGHACAIGIETRSSDGAWLFGDPLVSDWQWIEPSKIRSWAERWQSSIAFAVSRKAEDAPEPEPEPPPPEPPCYTPAEVDELVDEAVEEAVAEAVPRAVDAALVSAGDELVGVWLAWLRAPAPAPVDVWAGGSWYDRAAELEAMLEEGEVDPCAPSAPASWARGPIPFPADDALEALNVPALWELSGWRAAAWEGVSYRARMTPR